MFYIASWYNHEENDVREKCHLKVFNKKMINSFQEEEVKKPNTSNMQGLENEKPIPRGEPNEILNFSSDRYILTSEHQSSGEIKKEKSDLYRLQDEDLRSRIAENESDEHHITDDYVNIEHQTSISEYDPVVHGDSKNGRLHLSIRYDDERSQLIVQILNAEGLIGPKQLYAPEMSLTFTLIGPYNNDDETEKHTRIIVDNAAISCRQPMVFCITLENAIKQNLYVNAANVTDPEAPREREVREK